MISHRLEKVKLKSMRSQAKVGGTLTTVGGAMLMTLVKGPVIDLIWTRGRTHQLQGSGGVDLQHSVRGSLMITVGCFSWACFMVLQVQIYLVHLKLLELNYTTFTVITISSFLSPGNHARDVSC